MTNQGDLMKQMKFAMPFVGLLASSCGLGGNVYPMTPQQAYEKLVNAPIERSGKGPFGTMDISASGDGSSTIHWGNGSYNICEANLAPEGTDKTRITAYCGGGGEGAAAGIEQGLRRKALIELIDSTLRDRPFDRMLAYGSTAGSWPDDPRQADSSYGAAATEALKMDRDMHKDIAEMEKAAAEDEARQAERRANGNVNFKPGEPMITPSK